MPTREQIERQMNFDLATKNALRKHNDDENKIHLVEHHFYTGSREVLDELEIVGRLLGFRASEIKSGKEKNGDIYWYFDLLSEVSTQLNSLIRESLLMLALAEAYGAKYDGWGTLIAK